TVVRAPDGRRCQALLGQYGSDESKAEYARVLAEWSASPARVTSCTTVCAGPTVTELVQRFPEGPEGYPALPQRDHLDRPRPPQRRPARRGRHARGLAQGRIGADPARRRPHHPRKRPPPPRGDRVRGTPPRPGDTGGRERTGMRSLITRLAKLERKQPEPGKV